jgi:hypothetical protein
LTSHSAVFSVWRYPMGFVDATAQRISGSKLKRAAAAKNKIAMWLYIPPVPFGVSVSWLNKLSRNVLYGLDSQFVDLDDSSGGSLKLKSI